MEHFQPSWLAVVVTTVAMVAVMATPARGQISTPCNASIISSFTPCMNYLTNSSTGGGGSTPTAQCCNSLKALTNGGMDCLCLIVTGSVPFQLPINRTLAISLPRACNMPRIPVQCKATGSPLPAPGPRSLGPSASPASAPSGFSTPSPSPQAPMTPSEAPESDTTPPPSSSVDTPPSPSSSTSGRTDLPPSSAISSSSFSPSFLLIASSLIALLNYY